MKARILLGLTLAGAFANACEALDLHLSGSRGGLQHLLMELLLGLSAFLFERSQIGKADLTG